MTLFGADGVLSLDGILIESVLRGGVKRLLLLNHLWNERIKCENEEEYVAKIVTHEVDIRWILLDHFTGNSTSGNALCYEGGRKFSHYG